MQLFSNRIKGKKKKKYDSEKSLDNEGGEQMTPKKQCDLSGNHWVKEE